MRLGEIIPHLDREQQRQQRTGQIDQVIRQLDVEKLLESLKLTVTFRRASSAKDQLRLNCPFCHPPDRGGHLYICVEGKGKGLWDCKKGCGQGNLIHLVMRQLNVSYQEALEQVVSGFPFTPQYTTDELRESIEQFEQWFLPRRATQEALEQVCPTIPMPKGVTPVFGDFSNSVYHDKMVAWIVETAISENVVREFGVRYCYADPVYQGRLIIPVHFPSGRYVMFEARSIDGREPKTLYPTGSEAAMLLFNFHRVEDDRCFVVEGIKDVMQLASWGAPHDIGVSTFGAKMSEQQAQLLFSRFRSVCLAYDNDAAGNTAKITALKHLLLLPMDVHVLDWQPFKDASRCPFAEFLKKREHTIHATGMLTDVASELQGVLAKFEG